MDSTAVTPTELRDAVAVADTGYVGRAASRRHVSQPTLSARHRRPRAEAARAARGPLRLGVIPTLGPCLLPRLVPPLRKAYSWLRLVLREGMTSTLVDDLIAHRLDVALLARPLGTPGIACEPAFDEPFWVARPADRAFAKTAKLRGADRADRRVLPLTEGLCLREQDLACGDGRDARAAFMRARLPPAVRAVED